MWIPLIQRFVLEGARARFPDAAREGAHLTIKEPNGSLGAPLLSEALPESGVICLIRDPRDVAASTLDAYAEGSWRAEDMKRKGRDARGGSDVRVGAKKYAVFMGKSLQGYEAHKGPKVLVRYEDLLLDTEAEFRRVLEALEGV